MNEVSLVEFLLFKFDFKVYFLIFCTNRMVDLV